MNADAHKQAGRSLRIPHFAQYLGVWAMHEQAFRAAVARACSIDLAAHAAMRAGEPRDSGRGYVTHDSIAVIEIVGELTKYGSSLSDGPSTKDLKASLRNAVNDSAVQDIVLLADSPGGMTAGTDDLANAVREANTQKRVTTYIEDLGASALYWIASQSDQIVANPSALVGSIGTYGVIDDYSKAFEKQGIKTYVIRAGTFKGAGVQGTEVTDEQLAEFQREVNAINDLFVAAVARGRGMSEEQVRAVADGRVFIAAEAQRLGLIDSISSFNMLLDSLAASPRPATGNKEKAMSKKLRASETEQDEEKKAKAADSGEEMPEDEKDKEADGAKSAAPRAATIAELESIDGADASFVLACAKAGLTLAQAKAMRTVAANSAASDTKPPGGKGVRGADSASKNAGSGADAIAQFSAIVDEKLKSCGGNRAKAMAAAVKDNPELHQEYIAQYNAKFGRKQPS